MSCFYLSIKPLSAVNDHMGADSIGWARASFNVLVWKERSDTLLQEVLGALEDAGVGKQEETLFGSSQTMLPPIPGQTAAYLIATVTPGQGPDGDLDDPNARVRPGMQFVAHGKTQDEADALATRAYDVLVRIRNQRLAA